jgi:16S rRNA (cytosine1402-N4)-methyltransferase
MKTEHRPVLLEESLTLLQIRPGGVYLDCTLGDGGHAMEILKLSSPDGKLIGFDRDPVAVDRVSRKLSFFGDRFQVIQDNYRHVRKRIEEIGYGCVDGVLMDLGVSMLQLSTPVRGFSFLHDAPLDMRMNPEETGRTAYDWINDAPEEELRRILVDYGEEKRWRSIVSVIRRARERGPVKRTIELAKLIEEALPGSRRYKIHPATRTFQALRIAVNDELNSLREGLEGAVALLKAGGRLCVISFHSLEDRIVKQTFIKLEKGCTCPADFPVCACGTLPLLRRITKKPVLPSPREREQNPSARSAKLRVAEKVEVAA